MTPNNISAGRESQLHRMDEEYRRLDEEYNDDREDRYEISSEDERRYRENSDAEDEERRYQDEHDDSHARARSFRLSEFEEDVEHHYSNRWWGPDDEDEEGMTVEGEKTE